MQVGGILAVCVLAMAASARPHGIRIPEGLADAVVPETELTGITGQLVNGYAMAEFEAMKIRGKWKYLIFKISDSGTRSIEIDSTGGRCATIDEFVSDLPDKQCRFAVVNYSADPIITNLVFIAVVPDDARIRDKMLYASFKQRFRRELIDVGGDYLAQCSDSNACFPWVLPWLEPCSNRERTMMDKCGGYVCEPGEEHTADWEGCC